SQPGFDWERRLDLQDVEAEYRNLTALGELLLGYPNEYGKYTDRPLLDPSADPDALLPSAEDLPEKRDLGRNGTYIAFRDLRQDVRGFWQFLAAEAAATGNPRIADVPPGTDTAVARLVQTLGLKHQEPRDDIIASARFHRLLRRGREYGPPLSPEDALQPGSGDEDRGLRFLCLNANIARQLEF